MSCRDGSPSISMATPVVAAASNTRSQSAVTPGREPYLRPRGCPRMCTPRRLHGRRPSARSDRPPTAAPSAARRRRARASRVRAAPCRPMPSARMLASMPLSSRNRPRYRRFSRSISSCCSRQLLHRHAAGDLQPVGVIGDGAVVVAARDARLDDVLERLAAVAPRRVHLQVAAIVLEPRAVQRRVLQRREHLRAAEEVAAQIALAARCRSACPLSAIACSTVAEVPVVSTSRMTRDEDGPMLGIFRSVPSGCSSDSIGSSSDRIALAARL